MFIKKNFSPNPKSHLWHSMNKCTRHKNIQVSNRWEICHFWVNYFLKTHIRLPQYWKAKQDSVSEADQPMTFSSVRPHLHDSHKANSISKALAVSTEHLQCVCVCVRMKAGHVFVWAEGKKQKNEVVLLNGVELQTRACFSGPPDILLRIIHYTWITINTTFIYTHSQLNKDRKDKGCNELFN